jgi:hypothetical protein
MQGQVRCYLLWNPIRLSPNMISWGNMVDIEYPIPDNGLKHLCVRVGSSWYRVDISKVRQLARMKDAR